MKAIQTRYVGPTDTRGSRIIADDNEGNRAIVSYPHELSSLAAHAAAVRALCERMGWTGTYIPGPLKAGYLWLDARTPDHVTIP